MEETLLFTFAGSSASTSSDMSESESSSPVKKSSTPVSSPTSMASFEGLLESVQVLRSKMLLIETHHCCRLDLEDSEEEEVDSDNEEIVERD